MAWIRKGWTSPEGYPAVYCDSAPAVTGYLLPSGSVIDGNSHPLSCAGVSTATVGGAAAGGLPAGASIANTPGAFKGQTSSERGLAAGYRWDGSQWVTEAAWTAQPGPGQPGSIFTPPVPTQPAGAQCPTLVPGGSYRPTNSGNRYVFLDGHLHRIPDPETAAAHGWTDWVDADPSCFQASLIGDAIPSVKGGGGAPPPPPGLMGGPETPAQHKARIDAYVADLKRRAAADPKDVQVVALRAICQAGTKLPGDTTAEDDKAICAAVGAGGLGALLANPAVLALAGGAVALVAISSRRR